MRLLTLFIILALAACSSRSAGPPAPVQTVRVVGSSGSVAQMTVTATETPSVVNVPASLDEVWRGLPAVYESLGIPIGLRNDADHVIGNPGLRIRRRLGGAPLTRYLDCGRTQDGPNAETYEVHLSLQTRARPAAPGNTEVTTTLQAMARPITAAGEFIRCSTTGMLEARIGEAMRAQAGAG